MDINGHTALVHASARGHVGILRLLLAAGADMNMWDLNGDTTLLVATYEGQTEVVRLLLEAGVDMNMRGYCGATALIEACELGHIPIVRALLSAGANVDLQNYYGLTALLVASYKGHVEITRSLLEARAAKHVRDEHGEGKPAVVRAYERGHLEIVRLLERDEAESDVSHMVLPQCGDVQKDAEDMEADSQPSESDVPIETATAQQHQELSWRLLTAVLCFLLLAALCLSGTSPHRSSMLSWRVTLRGVGSLRIEI